MNPAAQALPRSNDREPPAATGGDAAAQVRDVVRRTWGFDDLRPLQMDAIAAGLNGRDSLVVLPTGGGKSLCFQVPPLVAGRTDLVISPLIALMKDQVDALRSNGVPAAAIYSGMSDGERVEVFDRLRAGELRLVYAAPERVLTPGFIALLRQLNLRSIAIDEAHCISHWGHDFRAEYRRLAELRTHFPQVALHAFTATATPRVREDIALQLQLREPLLLVGSFDRPNLTYRVRPRFDLYGQVQEALKRHAGEAAIIYCITRRETEELAGALQQAKVKADCYHAGLDADRRRRTQDAFANEKLDVIVATVAFGMGIDRSDVRLVLHTAVPKSVEHYQQEAGRAGRDGLPAECLLLYSAADAARWQRILGAPGPGEVSADGGMMTPEQMDALAVQMRLLQDVCRYAKVPVCRRRTLLEYFGETFAKPDCGACDVCLNELAGYEDATLLAQKVLSCVARVDQRFGVGHVVEVLAGAETERVLKFGHQRLSTYGLLKEMPREQIQRTVHHLLDQDLLERGAVESSGGRLPVLRLTPAALEVMRGKRSVQLPKEEQKAAARSRVDEQEWEGVDRDLFEELRKLRRAIAEERSVPPFVVFTDRTLRDMARRKPRSRADLLRVNGVGERKAADLGEAFLEVVARFNTKASSPAASSPPPAGAKVEKLARPPSVGKRAAFEMFQRGASLDDVVEAIGCARSTAAKHLCDYVVESGLESIETWVSPARYAKVAEVSDRLGWRRVSEIRAELGDAYDYETIRIVLAHIGQARPEGDAPDAS